MSELIATQIPHTTLRVHALDNVRVALADLPAGTQVEDRGHHVTLPALVRHKHKFVLSDMAVGDLVVMYGVTVGKVTQPIAAGEAITTGNLVHSGAIRAGLLSVVDVALLYWMGCWGWQLPEKRRSSVATVVTQRYGAGACRA